MRYLLLLSLLFFITNCGYEYKSIEEQDAEEEEKNKEPAKEESYGETCPDEERVENNYYGLAGEQCEGYIEPDNGGWYFSGKRLDWYSAEFQAPAGYRLPTRAELTEGYDSGLLEDLFLEYVWSSTESDDELKANIFQLANGQSAFQDKRLAFLVIYIVED